MADLDDISEPDVPARARNRRSSGAPQSKLEGLIEVHGFHHAAECWVFAGWVSRAWTAKPGAAVAAVFDTGRLPTGGALLFHERDDLGPDCIGFMLVIDAPRRPLGPIARLEFRDADAALDILPATGILELPDEAIAARARAILAAAGTPWEHADLVTRLARRMVGEGYIELYGHHEPSSGWLVGGWLSQAWINRADGPIEAVARFERGAEVAPTILACFERDDIQDKGMGVVAHVAAPDRGLGRLQSLTLRVGEWVAVAKPAGGGDRLTAAAVAKSARALLARAEIGPAVETLREFVERPVFEGRDTVGSLRDPVLMDIDETIVCGEDSVVLIGWLLARPGDIKAIRLRCDGGAFPVDMDRALHRVDRKDVIEGPGKQHGFEDPRCGFVARVATGRQMSGGMYLEIETAGGEIGFKTAPPARLEGLAAMKCLLGGFQTEYADVDAIYDHILGPAIGALNARRLRAPASARSLVFGEQPAAPRHSVIVPLYGRIDFMEVQMALFATIGLGNDVEILYVLDDPPRTRETQFLAASLHERFRIPFRLICLERNLGFAPANNVGLRAASGRFVCFMNSDVFPTSGDWLDRLAAHLESDLTLGAVGPLLEFEDGSVQHQGMFFKKLPQYGGWAFPHHIRKGFRPEASEGLCRVAAITGACMLLRRDTMEGYGGFDERFIIGDFEDTDLCLKLARDGQAVAVDTGVRMHHLERKSQASSAHSWRQSLTLYNAWAHQRRWGERLEDMIGADDRR
jgi:GT2 family glycosyltransferase